MSWVHDLNLEGPHVVSVLRTLSDVMPNSSKAKEKDGETNNIIQRKKSLLFAVLISNMAAYNCSKNCGLQFNERWVYERHLERIHLKREEITRDQINEEMIKFDAFMENEGNLVAGNEYEHAFDQPSSSGMPGPSRPKRPRVSDQPLSPVSQLVNEMYADSATSTLHQTSSVQQSTFSHGGTNQFVTQNTSGGTEHNLRALVNDIQSVLVAGNNEGRDAQQLLQQADQKFCNGFAKLQMLEEEIKKLFPPQ